MTLPRISVIMPNLNADRYIEQAICSVLDQQYPNLDWLVIDGGSIDASHDIIRLYENELTCWITEPDHGPADAINKGIAQATGEIIAIVSSDDLLLPGALHDVARRMTEEDKPNWLVGHCLRIDSAGGMLESLKTTPPDSVSSFLMQDEVYLPAAATFRRRDLFERYGRFNAGLTQSFHDEYNHRLVAARIMPTVLPQTVAARREHWLNRSAAHPVQQLCDYARRTA